jgi:hypothetical protein
MGEASSSAAVTHKVPDKVHALDDVPDSYVEILNDASMDIDSTT